MQAKRVLIFGGTGSLGKALISRLVAENQLLVYSRDEAKHWTLRNEYGSGNLDFAVGDVRDYHRVAETILRFRPNLIIVASALKQVETCELSPSESIQTNINGVKNVSDAVERNLALLERDLETVLLVSTDKACAPVNVYGMCKAIAERLITSRSIYYAKPKFVAVRYGNVLDSRGSIIPLFRHQAEHGRALTLTHEGMTRYLMTLDESVDLILETAASAKNGEVWIPRLKAMLIKDLAGIFAERYKKPIEVIGIRPGEKIHEALISDAESVRVRETDRHLVLQPAHVTLHGSPRMFSYTSADAVVSKSDLSAYLDRLGLLERDLSDFKGLRIEEIRTN